MKINFDLDLDYIDENGNVHEEIRKEVIATLTMQMRDEITKLMREEAKTMIHERLVAAVDEQLNKPFQPCDKWGDAKGEETTLRDQIKKAYEEFTKELVDENGRPSYGAKMTRVEYFVREHVKKQFDYSFNQMLLAEAAKAKEVMSGKIAAVLASSLVKG